MTPQELVDYLNHMMYIKETLDPHKDILVGPEVGATITLNNQDLEIHHSLRQLLINLTLG